MADRERKGEAKINTKRRPKGKAAESESTLGDEPVPDADDPEDYNIRSRQRTELLTELNSLLGAPVSPAFWACCQLSDMKSLEDLVNIAKINPRYVLTIHKLAAPLAKQCKLLN